MATPDQTEKATPPNARREARERGQVARSQDIGGAAIFLAIVIALHVGFMTDDRRRRASVRGRDHARRHRATSSTCTRSGALFVARAAAVRRAPGARVRRGGRDRDRRQRAAVRLAVRAEADRAEVLQAQPAQPGSSGSSSRPRRWCSSPSSCSSSAIVILICWLGVKDSLTDVLRAGARLAARHHPLGRGDRLRDRRPGRPAAAGARHRGLHLGAPRASSSRSR